MEKSCQQCGAVYAVRSKTQKFCSSACLGASQRTPPKTCQRCGTVFQPHKGSAIKFCSPACLHAARVAPKPRVCKHCHQEYEAAANTSKFCGVSCRKAHAKEVTTSVRKERALQAVPRPAPSNAPLARGLRPRPCDECGTVYSPSHTYQQFCSPGCKNAAHSKKMKGRANPNFRHGMDVDYYSPAFKKVLNKQVRAQYGACFQCGRTSSLHAHHLDETKTNNAPGNLACLCASCHIRYHKLHDQELRESMTSLWRKTIASWPKA